MIYAFSRISSGTRDIFRQYLQAKISSMLYLQLGLGEGERDIDELCKLPTCDELYGITRARPYFYMFVLLSPRSHFL